MKMGKATISDRLSVALFCAAYGWTYQEYISQPGWLIDLLRMKRTEDANYQKKSK